MLRLYISAQKTMPPKSNIDLDLRKARLAADDVVRRYGIEAPEHILLEGIAADLGVEIVEGPLEGCVARLVRGRERSRIRVSDGIDSIGRKRFSIAHELGHFQLAHAGTEWLRCADGDLSDFGGLSIPEAQANVFAAELLLPTTLVRKRCEVAPVNFAPILALANEFSTSITATAIRFAELSSEPCAIVFSQRGEIRWAKRSQSMWPFVKRSGSSLDPRSVAYDYFTKRLLHTVAEQVDISAWIDDERAARFEEIWEHSLAIPSIDAVLTILWLEEG